MKKGNKFHAHFTFLIYLREGGSKGQCGTKQDGPLNRWHPCPPRGGRRLRWLWPWRAALCRCLLPSEATEPSRQNPSCPPVPFRCRSPALLRHNPWWSVKGNQCLWHAQAPAQKWFTSDHQSVPREWSVSGILHQPWRLLSPHRIFSPALCLCFSFSCCWSVRVPLDCALYHSCDPFPFPFPFPYPFSFPSCVCRGQRGTNRCH